MNLATEYKAAMQGESSENNRQCGDEAMRFFESVCCPVRVRRKGSS